MYTSWKTEIMLTLTQVLFFVSDPQRQFDFKVCVATSCIIGGKVAVHCYMKPLVEEQIELDRILT